ncbi:MAG TPA: hypothetical protein PJ993_02820 [Candidatus Saccharibacteria bacterium]|nr:hypothetical protein [Candidatus Saccharibacteria bacterium]HMT39838.1 hypothetical protein [Candidatus Saccharibacteria bacterium]
MGHSTMLAAQTVSLTTSQAIILVLVVGACIALAIVIAMFASK